MKLNALLLGVAISAAAGALPVVAAETTKGGKGHHGAMQAPRGSNEAEALGVVNAIDADARTLNITHEPVKELGWPKMTMDLPVTRRVDLSAVKPGAKVRLRLKQGRDKQFRVMAIEPLE